MYLAEVRNNALMMTPKELLLEQLKRDGRPDRQLCQYEAFRLVPGDPVNKYLRAGIRKGAMAVNRWGVMIDFPEDAPGPMPHITPETKVLKDITDWRRYVHAPDLVSNCTEGWEEARTAAKEACGEEHLSMVLMGTGLFEQLHFLMGFEDTLTGFYEHPKEMHELIAYILEHRLTHARLLVENLHPDAVLSHDDWGTKESLFMSPEIWREFFMEPYRKFYSYFREHGVITIHHADSYLAPIVEDMTEIGIQIWQGVLPENGIPELQERLDGRMVLMGGIGAAIDRPDSEGEEIRSYVGNALRTYCPGGHFIPCITYGLPGTVCRHVDAFINEEISAYNSVWHLNLPLKREACRTAVTKRTEPVVKRETETHEQGSLLGRIASDLRKGRQKMVLANVDNALKEGIDARAIVSEGLIRGMMELGEDFSANRAFVPEMLVAAKCMSAALDVLRPLLQDSDVERKGRVCLGTVKGDMHDIGKNLVKIMLEGGGFEVVDLGVDVSAEKFLDTAEQEHCDIIACSALLTTTMSEMRRVVELATQRGIREKHQIIIGGAPITQQFCDEIGADGYSPDAAQCVSLASRLMEQVSSA